MAWSSTCATRGRSVVSWVRSRSRATVAGRPSRWASRWHSLGFSPSGVLYQSAGSRYVKLGRLQLSFGG